MITSFYSSTESFWINMDWWLDHNQLIISVNDLSTTHSDNNNGSRLSKMLRHAGALCVSQAVHAGWWCWLGANIYLADLDGISVKGQLFIIS